MSQLAARRADRPLDRIRTWVFDLDNTLYRVSERMHADIDRRIGAFLMEFLGVDAEEARRVQKDYFRRYGLTMRGLMVQFLIDRSAADLARSRRLLLAHLRERVAAAPTRRRK